MPADVDVMSITTRPFSHRINQIRNVPSSEPPGTGSTASKREKRREQEERENREKGIDRSQANEWQPEDVDSRLTLPQLELSIEN